MSDNTTSSIMNFVLDPDNMVPSTLTDLFEGSLCDDELNEIPLLLNLPEETISNTGAVNMMCPETMQLDLQTTTPPPLIPTNASVFVPVLPSPESTTSVTTSAFESSILDPSVQIEFHGIGKASTVTTNNKNKKRASASSTTAKPMSKRPKLPLLAPAPAPLASKPTTQPVPRSYARRVSNLTASASDSSNIKKDEPIDTSTAHIRALTGHNGAAVCLDAIEKALHDAHHHHTDASTVVSSGDDDKPLSAAEKAKQARDRNRQHARNTRIRKKAYVEELKRTLNQMVVERESVTRSRHIDEQRLQEQRRVRLQVLEEFLSLRGRNEREATRWTLILDHNFTLRMPRADIPGVVCSTGGEGGEGNSNAAAAAAANGMYPLGATQKILRGVNHVMEDAGMVTSLLQASSQELSIAYQCDKDSFLMDRDQAVLNWTATSSGAITKGASSEYSIEGTLRARFNPVSNKLVSVNFSF